MNIFKRRISLILSIVMLALLVLPIFIVSAANEINIKTTIGTQSLSFNNTYTVSGGESVVIKASSSNVEVTTVAYYFGDDEITQEYASEIRTTVPEGRAGSTIKLYVWAGGRTASEQVVPEWQSYTLRYANTSAEKEVTMDVTLNSKLIVPGGAYKVNGGEKIKAVATSDYADIAFIGYYYKNEDGSTTNIIDVNGGTLNITVPTGIPGKSKTLYIEAVASNNKNDDQTRTGWQKFILEYPEEVVEEKSVDAFYNGKKLPNNSTTEANPGESVRLEVSPADGITRLRYRWDDDAWQSAGSVSSYSTRIPSTFLPGSTHWLYVQAEYADGTVINRAYKFVIPENASDITMNVRLDSRTIVEGRTYQVEGGENVEVSASCSNSSVSYIKYHFGNDASTRVNASTAKFKVPSGKKGTKIKLYVEAVATDGTSTGERVYTLEYSDVKDGGLDVEPWMEENDEIADLAINLRNDSEEENKANKNIYALNEVVTYYIDYKNGTGDDITSEVSIVFDIPLAFTVVDADNGTVDKSDRTITWVFEDGLEEDEAGTLVVQLKYTSFSKARYDNERIYPSAAIKKGKKEMDRSTVINLIIEEYGMEINELHEPYMYGDLNANTFRPNDTITRAEGALVLARIYGLDYLNTRVTNIYSDLDETYEEAQKAIVAASKAGLINGYTNGEYRPNESMTIAEFMKILACMIEETADADGIDGLEIKDVDGLVKVYADSTRYYVVDGKRVYSHWALEEVTLLARLNMTPLSEDEDEIDLDAKITRAEVAQLVNFYLLRAPASVNSKTKSGFDDVTRKHDLFADIVEATRDAHTFSMEEDGTEVEE